MTTGTSTHSRDVHLTETGLHAGRTLCGAARVGTNQHAHAAYAPLDNATFRERCCTKCLEVWALEAYEDGDEMPDYIASIRSAADDRNRTD